LNFIFFINLLILLLKKIFFLKEKIFFFFFYIFKYILLYLSFFILQNFFSFKNNNINFYLSGVIDYSLITHFIKIFSLFFFKYFNFFIFSKNIKDIFIKLQKKIKLNFFLKLNFFSFFFYFLDNQKLFNLFVLFSKYLNIFQKIKKFSKTFLFFKRQIYFFDLNFQFIEYTTTLNFEEFNISKEIFLMQSKKIKLFKNEKIFNYFDKIKNNLNLNKNFLNSCFISKKQKSYKVE
jgi:hypothetical protein